ncbi:hypothetical protein [Maribellus sp. YY47]|uniref:hypothetical protein n=1 Tax=Maribellus sp. YY47 TaxID=2929486 RepID=UPI00200148C5|nr:hypothetical protein [Maribellus sp. YY47]MCK3682620.1 hypothetical protein [Maribellus sp. YY47]
MGTNLKQGVSGRLIGQGRSGKVYRLSENGNDLAVKVFSGVDSLTDLVNYVVTGAPNPYGWSEDAVMSAHLRREILEQLLYFWFGTKVRIAKSYGAGWHAAEKSFKISTEFVSGRPAKLHHPFSGKCDWELDDLTRNVMKPLQEKLAESGFDGLVWQAGKGNPIALNNFLLGEDKTWIWIDAESGVPALFPLNPFSLLGYYLPKSVRYRRALFDDVDIPKLRSYLGERREAIVQVLSEDGFILLLERIKQLDQHQKAWKSVRRIQKSINYQLVKGKINSEEADYYSRNKVQWVKKELLRFSKKAFVKVLVDLPSTAFRWLRSLPYLKVLKNAVRFLFNGDYRKQSVDVLLKQRITEWEKRGQLNQKSADFLRGQADKELASPYLSDFIILIGLKPLMNVVELFVFPALYAAGVISEATLVLGVALGGIIYRTLYTLGRMVYERLFLPSEKRHPRWIALFVGMIPTFGNLAYPTQMVYAAGSKSLELSEFLMYDISTRIGAKIPIWGGKDTLTEHFFNHLPDVVIRNRKALKKRKLMKMRRKQAAAFS